MLRPKQSMIGAAFHKDSPRYTRHSPQPRSESNMNRRDFIRIGIAGAGTGASMQSEAGRPPGRRNSGVEVIESGVAELQQAMQSGRLSAQSLAKSLPGAHQGDRQIRPAHQFDHRAQSGCAGDRSRARQGTQGEGSAWPAARHPGAAQGQHRHRRPDANHRRFAGAGRRPAAARRRHRHPPARSRRRDTRQDQSQRMGQICARPVQPPAGARAAD